MSASGFSNVIKEPSALNKNNFKDIQLLKSIYDESFDVANEFFSSNEGFEDDEEEEGFEDDEEEEGFEDDEDEEEGFEDDEEEEEGFEDDEEEGFEEGMKSKKKGGKKKKRKRKKKKHKTNFDLIGWAVDKAKGTKNDTQMVKNILHSLFVTFLSFLIAHNWYYTFFTNPTNFRLENSMSFLKENEFIHFFTMYIAQIVKTIDEFIMTSIPNNLNLLMALSPIGRRSIFYFILSVSLAIIPYLIKRIKSIFFYFEKQIMRLMKVIKSPSGLRKFIRDVISKALNSVFMFKGNPVLSAFIGITYVMKYMENLVIDHSKGIIENATEVIPSFFTKLLSGSIFYIIYLVFKFAMFYQPTVAFSSLIITVYLVYFSIVRLPKINGFVGAFSTVAENDKHMNDGKVVFKGELVPGIKTNIEEVIKFIMNNAHQIILLFTLKLNFKHLFNIESKFFKTTFIIAGITGAAKLLFSIFQKYGIGDAETQELGKEIAKLTAEIASNFEAPTTNDDEKQSDEKQSVYESMFDRIYKPYKTV